MIGAPQPLLPNNATKLERALSLAMARIDALPLDLIPLLHDPLRCPVDFLPILAAVRSVDLWDENWPDARKRQMVQGSLQRHARKGTPTAVEQALADLGFPSARVVERVGGYVPAADPVAPPDALTPIRVGDFGVAGADGAGAVQIGGTRGGSNVGGNGSGSGGSGGSAIPLSARQKATFRVDFDFDDLAAAATRQSEILALIDQTKRASIHLVSLRWVGRAVDAAPIQGEARKITVAQRPAERVRDRLRVGDFTIAARTPHRIGEAGLLIGGLSVGGFVVGGAWTAPGAPKIVPNAETLRVTVTRRAASDLGQPVQVAGFVVGGAGVTVGGRVAAAERVVAWPDGTGGGGVGAPFDDGTYFDDGYGWIQ